MMNSNGYLAPYVRAFFEDYLVCRRNLSGNTIQSYRDALKMFLAYAAEHKRKVSAELLVADISEPLMTSFLEHIEDIRENSIQTRNHRLIVLRSFFKYVSLQDPLFLEHCRRILAFPLKRGAVLPEVSYLEKDEINAIFDAIDRSTPIGRRDYALLLFIYNTGARVQEAADTAISWLSLEKPYKVEILGKGRKWRTCPLWESTVRALKSLIAERTRSEKGDHLFLNRLGQPISRFGIADIIQRYTMKAAESMPKLQGRKITPHTIRHTTAMHLLQSGVEINVIRHWLGHVSISTTNRYVEINLEMKAKALEACEIASDRSVSRRWKTNPDILTWLKSL